MSSIGDSWESSPHIQVAYGGGTNSCALLVGLFERGIRPAAITFADTGGEKPETYEHIRFMNWWLSFVGFPQIETLSGGSYWTPQMLRDGSLEAMCLRLGVMPSKAYGRSTCSIKWKLEPQQRWARQYAKRNNVPVARVVCLIGFGADEDKRVSRSIRARETAVLAASESAVVSNAFPLYEWGWTRKACVAAITRFKIPQPGKSACYFCPSTRKADILELRDKHPEMMNAALAMERAALSGENRPLEKLRKAEGTAGTKGLGRSFSWADYIKNSGIGNPPTAFDDRYCDPHCDTCYE